jgi:hypothetical protein
MVQIVPIGHPKPLVPEFGVQLGGLPIAQTTKSWVVRERGAICTLWKKIDSEHPKYGIQTARPMFENSGSSRNLEFRKIIPYSSGFEVLHTEEQTEILDIQRSGKTMASLPPCGHQGAEEYKRRFSYGLTQMFGGFKCEEDAIILSKIPRRQEK